MSRPFELSRRAILTTILALAALMTTCSSSYIVDEGHVGIIKRFGEAISQQDPGLHFKIPFVDTMEPMEVRTRKNAEQMASSTAEQMPVTAVVSVNWTVDRSAALDLYRKYGGLDQFEDRILDPRLRSSAKDILPRYEAERLIQDRAQAIAAIERSLMEEMSGFPVTIDNVQIENIGLPPKYIASIEAKQTEKNLADAEQHKLDRQGLVAQQAVNTAEADRDAAKARADGVAYQIETEAQAEAKAMRLKGEAEAAAIEAKARALRNNPLIVELTKAQTWNGELPKTVLGDGQNLLLNMGSAK